MGECGNPSTNKRNMISILKLPMPFYTVHIDLGSLPSLLSKNRRLLVIVDAFTKFVLKFVSDKFNEL